MTFDDTIVIQVIQSHIMSFLLLNGYHFDSGALHLHVGVF